LIFVQNPPFAIVRRKVDFVDRLRAMQSSRCVRNTRFKS